MKVNIQEIGECKRILEVEVPTEDVKAAYDKAYSYVRGRVQVSGFRKGKAPLNLIKSRYGEEVKKEVSDNLLSETFLKALEENDLTPVGKPQIEDFFLEEGLPMKFKVSVEIKPKLAIEDYKGIEIAVPSRRIDEGDIDRTIESVRDGYAHYELVEGRAVRDGDLAVINYIAMLNGEPVKNGEVENYYLKVGSGSFLREVEEGIIGMNVQEEKEITASIPQDYPRDDLAGKDVLFKIKLLEIKEKKLPDLDDEFLKMAGNFSSVEDLRNNIKESLVKRLEMDKRNYTGEKVIDKLIELHPFSIPESMIMERVRTMISDTEYQLSMQGVSNPREKLNYEALFEKMKPMAFRSVKKNLILELIAKREGLNVTDEELNREAGAFGEQMNESPEKIITRLKENNTLDEFKNKIKENKAFELLINSAIIKEEVCDGEDKK